MEKNQLQQRVIRRLAELGLGPIEAAKKVPELERNYIRDLVEDKKKSISHSKQYLVAEALQWTVSELLGEPDPSHKGRRNINHTERVNGTVRNPPLQTVPIAELMGEVDLPVYSIVQGGRGALVLENEPFTHIARPRRLAGKKKAYGVLVIGQSMAREYNEGDIAYVDPHLPPRKGDPCVFQGERPDGTVEAIIKYLERSPDASETFYYVSQSQPPKKYRIKKSDWQRCHVAVGKESGR